MAVDQEAMKGELEIIFCLHLLIASTSFSLRMTFLSEHVSSSDAPHLSDLAQLLL